MAKQATNRARNIKLPVSQYTQTGRETERTPDSKLTGGSGGSQGQQNFGVCKGTTNRRPKQSIRTQMGTKHLQSGEMKLQQVQGT
jgi:hypothetical protein